MWEAIAAIASLFTAWVAWKEHKAKQEERQSRRSREPLRSRGTFYEENPPPSPRPRCDLLWWLLWLLFAWPMMLSTLMLIIVPASDFWGPFGIVYIIGAYPVGRYFNKKCPLTL